MSKRHYLPEDSVFRLTVNTKVISIDVPHGSIHLLVPQAQYAAPVGIIVITRDNDSTAVDVYFDEQKAQFYIEI